MMITYRLLPNTLIILGILIASGCATGIVSPDSGELSWSYQEGERRLNFKNVHIANRRGKRAIVGTVENVGDENWPNPTVNFTLLNGNMERIGAVSVRKGSELGIGSEWKFEIIPRNQNFYRPRFAEPTGWR